MKHKLKIAWLALNALAVVMIVAGLIWLASLPDPVSPRLATTAPTSQAAGTLRIGLVPERDVFSQRRRYQALADYLAPRLGRAVELVTSNTYEAVLEDFSEKHVDAAFLGSLVTVLAADRLGCQVIAEPESESGVRTYHGVLLVREDLPIRKLEDLRGRRIAMVRMTTAGHVFPGCIMMRLGMLNQSDSPKIVWTGTHDEAVEQVVRGEVDAAAVKNLRMDDLLKAHPQWRVRILARSNDVPDNALVVRPDLDEPLKKRLREFLLGMAGDPAAGVTLRKMGLRRFVPCDLAQYSPVYDMIDCIRPAWKEIGVPGAVPTRPASVPAPDPQKIRKCYDVRSPSAASEEGGCCVEGS